MTNQEYVLNPTSNPVYNEAQTWIEGCLENGVPDTHFDLLYAILDQALESSVDQSLVNAAKDLLNYRFDQ